MVEKWSSKGITTSSSTRRPSITSRLTSNGMISFGVASGWSTLSGCGSKVSTVSAPSITRRWPTWTPSKVPMAISRGRRTASARGVTAMLISGRLYTDGRALRRAGAALARSPRRPRRGRSQAGGARCIGVAEVGDQAADIGSRRALDLELGLVAGTGELLELVHGDQALGQLEALAAAGAAVGALAPDTGRGMGRRALADVPRRQLELAGGDDAGRGDLALWVAGGRDGAEARPDAITLGQFHEPPLLARRGPADEDDQQPGRERVQGPGVAGLRAELAAHPDDDVVGGDAWRLVDEDDGAVAPAHWS